MPGYWRAPCVRLSRLGDSVSCVLSGVALRRFLAPALSIGCPNLVLAPACTSPLLPAAATSLPPSAIKPNPISSVKISNNKKYFMVILPDHTNIAHNYCYQRHHFSFSFSPFKDQSQSCPMCQNGTLRIFLTADEE